MQYQIISWSCYSHFLTLWRRCLCFSITCLCLYLLLYPHQTQWLCGSNLCALWDRNLLLGDLAFLYINYKRQRLYWLGDLLIIGIRFTGRFVFGSQCFMLCKIRMEMAMNTWNVRVNTEVNKILSYLGTAAHDIIL